MDKQGYFHRRPPATIQQADPAAVGAELRLQLQRALEAGLDLTHVDAHRFAAARPAFRQLYVDLALEYRLPLLLTNGPHAPDGAGMTAEMAAAPPLARQLAERGVPLFDSLQALPLDDPRDHAGRARQLIDALRPGLTLLLLHPAADTPELRALAPDWQCRVANAATMHSSELRDYIHQAGVHLIGYRPLRELLRGQA
jgi:predicted glycoside hydrolase/deacetylase ChbG (UPF0249 family)